MDEDRDDLRLARHLATAADYWDTSRRPDSELYRGGRLEAATEWRARTASGLGPQAAAFLDASVERADAEQRVEADRLEFEQQSNRRLRRLLAGVGVLLAFALVAGAVAFQQRRSAQETAHDAETSRLVATAQSLADTNPRAALLLAVAAHQREQTPETLGALQVALTESAPVVAVLGREQSYVDVEWLSNDLIAGVRVDGIDLFDPQTTELLDSVELPIGPGVFPGPLEKHRAAVAPDAPMLSVLTDDPDANSFTLLAFDTAGRRLHQVADISLEVPGTSSAIHPGRDRITAVGVDNVLRVFDLDGTELWNERLDQSPNLFAQALPVVGPDAPFRDIYAEIPVLSAIHPADGELVVGTGVLIRRFGWDGVELAEPWFLTSEVAPGQVTLDVAWGVLTGDDGPRSIVSNVKVWTEETAFEPALDGATVQTTPIGALLGAGLPDFIDGRSTVIGDVYLLSDGSLASLDPEGPSVDYVARIPLGSATSLAVDPVEFDTAAVASAAGGLTIIDLLGAGPMADGFPRPSNSRNLTIAADGRTALTAGAGGFAPSELWRRGPDGWSMRDFRPGLFDVFGAIPPNEGDFIEIRDEQLLTWIYSFDDASTTELLSESPQPGANTGNKNLELGLVAYSGGFAFGDPVRVQTFPDLEIVTVLPIPQVDALASANDLQFDPMDTRLLVAMPDGQFDVWDVATWQRIDVGEWRDERIALASWNADGSLGATAAPDGTVTIRDGADFGPIRTMVGNVDTSNSWSDGTLLFSPDNDLLLTNIDGVGRLWDVASGQQIGQPFQGARGTNSGINVGENGLQLITGTETGALIWNLDTDSWPEIACRAAGSNLSEDEWAQWGPRDESYREICTV